jgi:hypothetical protein
MNVRLICGFLFKKPDKNSGQLSVMKGSHLNQKTLRVVPQYPRPFVGFQDTHQSVVY